MVWNKMTHDEFMCKVIDKNKYVANGDIVILGEYIDCHSHIKCKCNVHNVVWNSTPTSLYSGCGCAQCGRDRSREKILEKYNDFLEKLELLNNGIIAIGDYVNMTTPMEFQCSHGHTWLEKPTNIIAGQGCPYCSNHRVLVGFNDMWTTRPDVAKMLKNKDDGYKYTAGSNKKLDFICPECGSICNKYISFVSLRGLCCQTCSDGISYPNKFIRHILKQLKVDFIPEYSPVWAKPRKYDCYFKHKGQEYIVEMDGAFHYIDRESINHYVKESQANDNLKTLLANQHGICIIRIECIESNVDYIKNKILSSELSQILDLSNIDWSLCDKNAQKSLVKEACNLYMSETHDIKKLSSILNIHSSTVRRYLKLGVKFGWCNYSNQTVKAVVVVDNENNVLHYFYSGASCSREMEQMYGVTFGTPNITKSCQTHRPYKGFNFRFANE